MDAAREGTGSATQLPNFRLRVRLRDLSDAETPFRFKAEVGPGRFIGSPWLCRRIVCMRVRRSALCLVKFPTLQVALCSGFRVWGLVFRVQGGNRGAISSCRRSQCLMTCIPGCSDSFGCFGSIGQDFHFEELVCEPKDFLMTRIAESPEASVLQSVLVAFLFGQAWASQSAR